MKNRVLAVVVLGATAMMACSLDSSPSDPTDTTRQALAATNIIVNGSALATNARLVLRITGPGYSATVNGFGTIPPIFANGTFTIATASGNAFGTFIVESGIVVTTTGALTINPSGLGFDLTRLARVEVPFASISVPAGGIRGGLGGDSDTTNQTLTAFLPDGVYSVTGHHDHSYGGFVVQARAISATSGGLSLTPTGVAFDATKLPNIVLNARALSEPPGLQELVLFEHGAILGIFRDDMRFLAPMTGSFQVTDKGPEVYGSITIDGSTVTSATGAFKPTSNGVEIDNTKLAQVTIPLSSLSIHPTSPMQVVMTGSIFKVGIFPFGGMFTGFRDPLLRLPDGHYEVNNASGRQFQWGSFDVADRAVVSGAGAFKAGPGGSLQIQSCALAAVTILSGGPPPPPGAPPMPPGPPLPGLGTMFQIPGIFGPGTSSLGGTFLLPAGAYTITAFGQPGTGSFVVPANGPITNVVQPPYIQTLSGSMGSCGAPPTPTTSCVGTPLEPVTLPGSCRVMVDNVNKLAGGCTANAVSCRFDGFDAKEINAGTQAIVVTGTAADGTTSTCTSHVRVLPCPVDAPTAHCVGTPDNPLTTFTMPGLCGIIISGPSPMIGGCTNPGGSIASCLFDGQAQVSLSVGDHDVTVLATSPGGATSSCTSYLRVVDRDPPHITCAPPMVRECQGPRSHVTTNAMCFDSCTCAVSCESGDLGLGEHTLACSGSDPSGATASCNSTVKIVDTVAPSIGLNVTPKVLWPPSHELVLITIDTSSVDLCDPNPNITCSASSSEAPLTLGSGNTPADIVWNGSQLYLRAERSGLGSGRVYTITCTASDAAGNTRSTSATVTVPKEL